MTEIDIEIQKFREIHKTLMPFERILIDLCKQKNNYQSIYELITLYGVSPNKEDKKGRTPLYYACMSKNIKLIEFLIKYGADVNYVNRYGDSILLLLFFNVPFEGCGNIRHDNHVHIEIGFSYEERDYSDVIKLLIKHGADVNIKDNKNQSLLLYAANSNFSELMEICIESGANVNINIRAKYNTTPLFLTVYNDNYHMTKLLLEKGADTNVKNNRGDTPLLIARKHSHIKIEQLLIEYGAKE